MTPTETAAKLRVFNDWRRGELDDLSMPNPREIGEAIDAAVEMIESAEEDRALCDKLSDIPSRTGTARFYRNSRPAQLAEAMQDGEVWTTNKATNHFGWSHAAAGEAKTSGTTKVYLYRRVA